MLARWARMVVRHRALVLAAWALVLVAGAVASTRLTPLLGNSFTVPGTDSERARILLQQHFGERPDGTFTVVFETRDKRGLAARLARAARVVPTGTPGELHTEAGITFGDVSTTLDLQHAKRYTGALRRALRGSPRALVTGQPAVQADLDPIFSSDLRRGESLALPLTLVVLVLLFGLSLAVVVPFLVAACTIGGTLALLYLAAHELSMVAYTRNLVELIGLGLAVDYSLLLVHRYREELQRDPDDAVARTIETAGRAIAFSGLAVAVGLGLLLVVPVPFIRSMGVGGLLVPLVSVAAALTLQPALLSYGGRRLLGRTRDGGAFWGRLAGVVMARPWHFLAGGVAVLAVLAAPVASLRLTPGSLTGIPASAAESVRGYNALQDALGGGLVTPTHIVVVGGDAAATKRLVTGLLHDPESLVVSSGTRPPFVEAGGRYRQVVVANRHPWGSATTHDFVERVRDRIVPAARFAPGTRVYAGGAPPQGVDFVHRAYGAFPWLIVLVLGLTYAVLLRAFRSVVLPLKALVLNALTVVAAYGVLSFVFDHPIEAWIPVFLFAALFGLSMDYEVFMVTRMREAHDAGEGDVAAVSHGLQRTGPVVSACAAIMAIAFAGFAIGRIEGLREFGVGLVVAVVLDATVVRGILLPAAMGVLGRWNWWLPRLFERA